MRLYVMSLIAIALALPNVAFGQDRQTGRETSREQRREYREVAKVEVEDPADFGKERGEPIFSGPQPGEAIPDFKIIAVGGEKDGEEISPLAEIQDKPTILYLGGHLRGIHAVLKAVQVIESECEQDLHVVFVILDSDKQRIKQLQPVFQSWAGLPLDALGYCEAGSDGPATLGLDRNMQTTIILAKDGKVSRNFVFPQGMVYADPHVLGGLAELIARDRDDVAQWLTKAAEESSRESMQAKRRDGTGRQATFMRQLSALVEAGKLTREEAGELFQAAFGSQREERSESGRDRNRE